MYDCIVVVRGGRGLRKEATALLRHGRGKRLATRSVRSCRRARRGEGASKCAQGDRQRAAEHKQQIGRSFGNVLSVLLLPCQCYLACTTCGFLLHVVSSALVLPFSLRLITVTTGHLQGSGPEMTGKYGNRTRARSTETQSKQEQGDRHKHHVHPVLSACGVCALALYRFMTNTMVTTTHSTMKAPQPASCMQCRRFCLTWHS